MAKNDQDKSFGRDGRSLEEQLASLDALSNEPSPEGEEAKEQQPAAEPTTGSAPEEPEFPANPWLNNPPDSPPAFPEPSPPPYAPGPWPPAPGSEGPPPYGAQQGPGYPPDFGVHQPPQYPGQSQPEGFSPYPPTTQDFAAQPPPDFGFPPVDGEYAPPFESMPPAYPGGGPDGNMTQRIQMPGDQGPTPEGPGEPAQGPEGAAPAGYENQGYPESGYAAPPAFPDAPTYSPPPLGEQQYAPQYPQGNAGYPAPPVEAPPVQGPPMPPHPGGYMHSAPQTADSLSPEMLLRGRRHAPACGWRKALYTVTGGMVHPGESPAELRRRELVARASTPVAGGHHRVAVMSLKGGVGKTTTTVGLGSTLAATRGDRVIAVDANPDRGTLSDKVRLETAATVRDLLNERAQIQRYADVRSFTSQAPSRLEVLASDRDPAVSEAFSEDDYRSVAHVLEHFYSICITDCGTGLLHSAMAGVLGLANQVVLVSSPSVDGARSASATLDWMEAHQYGDLVRNGVVVLSMVRPRSKSSVDLDRLERHFATRCRAVVRIPYDPHLEEGAEVDLEQLNAATQDAYLVLAATVGDGFAWPQQ